MEIKYNIDIKNTTINNLLNQIINQTYKLLPFREEGQDWEKPLQTLIQQFVGLERLVDKEQDLFFLILCKMEGLFNLKQQKNMQLYRRTIFSCLRLLNNLKQKCLF